MQLLSPEYSLILWMFVILPVILVIAAVYDLMKYSTLDSNTKLMWLLIILFIPFVGTLMYFTIGKKQKLKV